ALYAYRTLCVIFICNPDFQMAVFPIQFFRRNLFSIQDIHCFHGDRKFLFCCPLIKDVLSFCLPCKPVSILRNVLVPFDVFYPVQNTFVSDCSGTLNPFQLFGNGYRLLLSRSICININRFLLTDRIISCIFASCSAHRHRRQHHRHPGRQRRSHFLFPFSVSAHHSFPFLHLKSGCFFLSRKTCRILLLSKKSDGRFAYYTVKNHKHSRKNENYYTHADQCTSCQQRTDRADHINIGICRHTECSRKKAQTAAYDRRHAHPVRDGNRLFFIFSSSSLFLISACHQNSIIHSCSKLDCTDYNACDKRKALSLKI